MYLMATRQIELSKTDYIKGKHKIKASMKEKNTNNKNKTHKNAFHHPLNGLVFIHTLET